MLIVRRFGLFQIKIASVTGIIELEERKNEQITLDNISVSLRSTLRNLGVLFDQDLSFKAHVKPIKLHIFTPIRNILSKSDAEVLNSCVCLF